MYNKTIWSEGMFLQPQHFQQQDRYFEFLFRSHIALFQPYSWGFDSLELDQELLALGKIGLKQCRGLFPDGTLIDIPNISSPPCPLVLPPNTTNCTISLAIPLRHIGLPEVTDDINTVQPIRYLATSKPVQNNTSDLLEDTVYVTIGNPRLTLFSSADNNTAYSHLNIAHVDQIVAGQGIRLNQAFIPPMLNANKNTILQGYINEIMTLLTHRAETLAGRVAGVEDGGISELADFMLLQLMNEYSPLINSIAQSSPNHPFKLYNIFTQLSGEMTTYTKKCAVKALPYDHDNLANTFSILLASLRQSFLLMINQNAQSLPVEAYKPGLWIVKIPDKTLLETTDFVVVARAHVTSEELHEELPKTLKISAFEEITDLVTHSLPGIALQALPVVPRKIPFYAGYSYFSLDQNSPLWQKLKTSSGLGFHLSSQFPDFQFEVWTIQRTDNQYIYEE